MYLIFQNFLISLIINFIFIIINVSMCSNIDTTNPIIISNHYDGSDSFFGATVMLLEKDETSNSLESSSWVIIGAPKANSTHKKHKNIYEPGVVWRCSLGRKSQDFCEVIVMDPTDNKNFPQEDENGAVYDRKDGGWLGGSMFSSNNGENSRFVTCANRWQNQYEAITSKYSEHNMMNGICYWRPTKHLKAGNILPDLPLNYRLYPLRDRAKQAIGQDYTWVFGQAGFSLHITDDKQLIIGAPGMNVWRGGVISFTDQDTRQQPLRRNGLPNEYGGIFEKVIVSSSDLNPQLNVRDSYLGYSVTSGKFIGQPGFTNTPRTIQFAGGAPRGNKLFGKVIIFTFPIRGSRLSILQEINGTKIGTYFGSVLCSVDINNDGYEDLLIGAPQFSTKLNPKFAQFRAEPLLIQQQSSHIIKYDEFGDEGRVFIYLSSGAQLIKQGGELNGGNTYGARFGSAISSLGDINNDGFKDIAVGAPYENDGRGAVYIYFGSSEGIVTKSTQIIQAKDLHSSLHGFGYSLSNGVDIDKNGYNDLAVGSYVSSQSVILRTRPIVNLIGEITTKNPSLPLNATEFQFQICVSYNGKHAPMKLDISVKLTMDIDSKPPRVHIRNTAMSGSVTKLYTFKGVTYKEPSCEIMTGVVLQALVVSGNGITIKSEVSLSHENKLVNPTFYELTAQSNGFPQLSSIGPKYEDFCSDCPIQSTEGNIGKPFYFSLPLQLPCGSDNKCISDLQLKSSFLEINPGKGFVIGSKNSLALKITLQNLGEAALSPTLKISWKKINLIKIPSDCEILVTGGDVSNFAYLCRYGDLLGSNKHVDLTLEFDMRDLYSNEKDEEFKITIEAKTTSEIKSQTPTILNLAIPLIFEGDIFITSKNTTLILSPETISPYQFLSHKFEVGLQGISSVNVVWLNFEIPVKLIGYLDRPIIEITNLRANMDGEILECIRSTEINNIENNPNHFKEQLSEDNSEEIQKTNTTTVENQDEEEEQLYERILKKREINKNTNISSSTQQQMINNPNPKGGKLMRNGIIRMDCLAAYVQCEKYECQLHKFKPGNQVNIDFTLKIATEDIRKIMNDETASILHIQSIGKIKLNIYSSTSYIPPIGHKPDEINSIIRIELDSANVPKWVYMASFSGGFVCLASLIFCFYACGCFERKKKLEVVPPEEEEEKVDEFKPLQSQTIPEEEEPSEEYYEHQSGNYTRQETLRPEDRPEGYYYSR